VFFETICSAVQRARDLLRVHRILPKTSSKRGKPMGLVTIETVQQCFESEVYNKFTHCMKYSFTAAATYTLYSSMSKNKSSIIRSNLKIYLIWQLQYQELKLIIVLSH
jgi:hypothetical protein